MIFFSVAKVYSKKNRTKQSKGDRYYRLSWTMFVLDQN